MIAWIMQNLVTLLVCLVLLVAIVGAVMIIIKRQDQCCSCDGCKNTSEVGNNNYTSSH